MDIKTLFEKQDVDTFLKYYEDNKQELRSNFVENMLDVNNTQSIINFFEVLEKKLEKKEYHQLIVNFFDDASLYEIQELINFNTKIYNKNIKPRKLKDEIDNQILTALKIDIKEKETLFKKNFLYSLKLFNFYEIYTADTETEGFYNIFNENYISYLEEKDNINNINNNNNHNRYKLDKKAEIELREKLKNLISQDEEEKADDFIVLLKKY